MTDVFHHANGDSIEYWKAAREGRLVLQHCKACGAVQFPPRHHCATCWEADVEWTESAGRGEVESFTIVRRAPLPELRDKVPFVVAAIRLDDGPRMLTNIVGPDALDTRIGAKVTVTFETGADGENLPQFALA